MRVEADREAENTGASGAGPRTGIEQALEDVAESLRVSAATMEDGLPSRPKARLVRAAVYVGTLSALASLAVLIAVLITLFTVLIPSESENHAALGILKVATSPKQVSANSQQTRNAVVQIIACEENHTNRIFEVALGYRVEPIAPHCPTDTLPHR